MLLGTAQPEISDLQSVDHVASVGLPDRWHPSHMPFLHTVRLTASAAFASMTSPRLPTSAISIPARRKVPSVSGTTAT